jgi:protein O-mannosyl-transferase
MLTMSCRARSSSPAVAAESRLRKTTAHLMAHHELCIIGILKNLQRVGAILVIIAATLFVYWPAQRNGFVWDDTALVQRDPLIRSWRLIPEGFRHFLFIDATASNFYRPLQRLSFTADYALWNRNAGGWHLSSIYVHLAAAMALFFLAEKITARRGMATAVALLWAIHPLHTSAVTYIAGRADPLQALFGFMGLTLGLVSLDGGRRARIATWAAAVCFLCALLSKEAGFAALLIWFAVLAWRRVPRAVWGKWIALGVAVVAVYAALRFTAESTPPPRQEVPPASVRPILAARAVAEYAGLILAPVNLRMERDVSSGVGVPTDRDAHAQRREWQTILGAALIAGGFVWWRWARRRTPVAALALIAGLIAYLPVSNLFALNASVAEHWLYVPLAFLFIAAAMSLREIPKAFPVMTVVISVWAAWLGWRTWHRQEDWKDQRTFLMRNIAAGGDSARMRVNLARLESESNRDDLALEEMRKALTLAPNQPHAQLGAAAILIRANQLDAAEALLAKAETHPVLVNECRLLRASLTKIKTGADITPLLREAALAAPDRWPTWRAAAGMRCANCARFSKGMRSARSRGRCLAICWRRSTTTRVRSRRSVKRWSWMSTTRPRGCGSKSLGGHRRSKPGASSELPPMCSSDTLRA